jgi:DNA-binding MarR family transcriptional regulator
MVKNVTAGVKASPAASEAWGIMRGLMMGGTGFDQFHGACAALGIPLSVAKSLMHIQPDQPEPMRAMAERWRCDASYITSIVDDLEELGLANRQPHLSDRRIKTVALTSKGEELRVALMSLLSEPPLAFDALSPAEQRQLRDLLSKVAAAAESVP